MSAASPAPPEPSADRVSAPYWEALRNGSLVLQRCSQCHRFQHFPSAICGTCLSFDLRFEPVSGQGRVDTFVTIHHVTSPAYADRAPYSVAWVELPEQAGLRVLGIVETEDAATPRIGADVRLRLVPVSPRLTLPEFVVAS
ncbi:Zn-ribbon domain-containing OB-fold protein [Nocardioides humi]